MNMYYNSGSEWNLEVMSMKRYSTFFKTPEQEFYHEMV